MSTKTTFKRIALATVAVMGFGLLSVAPASAGNVQATWAYGTLPTTNVAAGGTITVPVTYAATTTGTNSVGDKWIIKAHISTAPTNATITTTTSSVATSALVAAESTAAAAAGTGNTSTTGASITVTNVAGATVAATVAGSFSFVAPVAGAYVMTLTATVLDSDPAGTDSPTATVTDATLEIQVSGASLVQAESGLGTATGTQVTDRSAAAVFCVPAASASTSRYTVTATGATITGANSGADQADAVNASTYTSASGIVQNTPNSYATGFTFEGQRTTNLASLAAGVNDCFIVRFTSATAGAATVTARLVDAVTGVATSIGAATVTFGAAAAVSPSLSTVFIGQGNVRPTTVETTAIRVPSTAGVALASTATTGATIAIDVKDASGAALVNQAITATITGSGLITLASGTGTGSTGTVRTASLTATTMASASQAVIGVSADGTRGVGTITITAGGVTIATKTVTFYGAVATLTATQGVKVMRSGRTAASTEADFTLGGVDPAQAAATAITRTTATNISIVAKDVDGNVVPLAANPTAVISDALVVGAVNIASCAGGASTSVCAAGAGNYIANTVSAIGGVSGAAATVTFQTPHPTVAGTFISTAALPFTLGGTALGGTVTMTLNKATYEPGERMIITYTAKDAAGNPVRDWTTAATPTANKNVPGLAGGTFVAGSAIIGDEAGELVYAPVSPGAFIITLATGTATGAEITATATVSDDAATTAASAAGDAAAEATDAANAATDAANAAAEAADAATAAAQDAADAVAALSASVATMVSDLKKQITSLTNLVIKIQKKVRA
jgi:trimeric autotransporter adhesin